MAKNTTGGNKSASKSAVVNPQDRLNRLVNSQAEHAAEAKKAVEAKADAKIAKLVKAEVKKAKAE